MTFDKREAKPPLPALLETANETPNLNTDQDRTFQNENNTPLQDEPNMASDDP
jgi:hypothetical protein